MPRSFLVKKPSSNKVPNYGQLETLHRGSHGSSLSWREVASPCLTQDISICPATAPCEAESLWDRSSVIACLSPPQSMETKREPGLDPQVGIMEGTEGKFVATRLRDHQDNLAVSHRRTPNVGSPAEGDGSVRLGEPGTAAEPRGPFECPDCCKAYGTFGGLSRHRQQRCKALASAASRRYFSCKSCDKEYASLGALKMHIRTHTLPCVCKICGKAFSRPWLLQGHIRTHTGEKPYACSHCSRAFADRSNLRAHLQTHSEVKKYPCPSCLKTFSRMSLLLRHEEAACCLAAT
ncbi:zinc finger protein SNAI3 [Anolis carolinensis]|uniref:zinc finger protein SNAI3 n=1 Tax=Anolis carolinensis TaxID=28377 RepID=UPI002F2B7A27